MPNNPIETPSSLSPKSHSEAKARTFSLPNDVVFQEVVAQLAAEGRATLPIEGRSMEPLLMGGRDKIVLAPVRPPLRCGDVVLYCHEAQWVLHRIVRVKGDRVVLRGDACADKEEVDAAEVRAVLRQIIHADGTVENCTGSRWQWRSRRAVWSNAFHRCAHRLFNQRVRRRLAPFYFILLAVLMWSPLGALGVPLDNFVLGIRLDHVVHASIYLFCTWFLMDIRGLKGWQIWLLGCAVGVVTESVQYLLPYRGFDINDLIANFFGASVGWCVMLWLHGRPRADNR